MTKRVIKVMPTGMFQLVNFPEGIVYETSDKKKVIDWLADDSEDHESSDVLYAATDTEGTYEEVEGEQVKKSDFKELKKAHSTLIAETTFGGWPAAGKQKEAVEE
jgi:hypothetical protein